MKRRFCLLSLIFLFCWTGMTAQQREIDSLNTVLNQDNLHDSTKALVLKTLAWRYMNIKPDTAMLLASQSYDLSEKNGHRPGIKNGLNTIGGILLMTGNLREAAAYYGKLLKLEKQDQILPRLKVAYNNLGSVYAREAAYDSALFYYNQSLEVARTLGIPGGIAHTLSNISIVLTDYGKLNEAKAYLQEALDIVGDSDNTKLLQGIWESLGKVYLLEKEYDEAVNAFESSLLHARQTNDRINEAAVNNLLGSLFLEQGDERKSLEYHRKALESHKQVDDKFGIVGDNISIAKNLLSRQRPRYVEAERILLAASDMAQSYGHRSYLMECWSLLSGIREEVGDLQGALDFQKQYQVLRDSVFNDQQNRALAEVRTKYETSKIQNELVVQQKELELLEARSGRQRLYIFLGIATTVIIGMIAYFIYARQKETRKKLKLIHELQAAKQQQFQKELDFKHRELTSNTLFLAEKSRVLLDIQEQLMSISDKGNSRPEADYSSILKLISEHTDMDNEWDTLKRHFDQVHPDFFKNLYEAHPKLSQNELKHCAYVLMNLSVKEVARILNINSSSVQMSRYRLKKKMDIPEEVTLSVHLHKIADSMGLA